MPLTEAQRRAVARMEMPDPVMVGVLRNMTPTQRLDTVWSMWRFARDMLLGVIRSEHPEWTEEAVARDVARRMSHGAV